MDKTYEFETIKSRAKMALARRLGDRPDVIEHVGTYDYRLREVLDLMNRQPMPADFDPDRVPGLVNRLLCATDDMNAEIERMDVRSAGVLLELLPEIVPTFFRGKPVTAVLDDESQQWTVRIAAEWPQPDEPGLDSALRGSTPSPGNPSASPGA